MRRIGTTPARADAAAQPCVARSVRPRLPGTARGTASGDGRGVSCAGLHEARRPGRLALRVHRGPVRRPGRAPLPPGLEPLPAGDAGAVRQGADATADAQGSDPRSGRLVTTAAGCLFAWKKSPADDYHLYELDVAGGQGSPADLRAGLCRLRRARTCPTATSSSIPPAACRRSIAGGPRSATCTRATREGRYMRRLGFDQVHTNFPTVTARRPRALHALGIQRPRPDLSPGPVPDEPRRDGPDGVLREQLLVPHHDRARPRTFPARIRCWPSLCGHHSRQAGKLGVLDPPGAGRRTPGPILAPVRETRAVRVDGYGQQGDLFQYPYPLSETEYLVTYAPLGWGGGRRGRRNGRRRFRHLLDGPSTAGASCWPATRGSPATSRCRSAAAAAAARPSRSITPRRPARITCRTSTPARAWRACPAARSSGCAWWRSISRRAGIGNNGNGGPAGAALVGTPVAVGNGCWDPKIVLGERQVHDDGSAVLQRPARTPVYFQAIDATGTPCRQCGVVDAAAGRERRVRGLPRVEELHAAGRIAPALALAPAAAAACNPSTDRRGDSASPRKSSPSSTATASRCHNDRRIPPRVAATPPAGGGGSPTEPPAGRVEPSFSLLGEETVDAPAKRGWSDAYLALTDARPEPRSGEFHAHAGPLVNWIPPQSAPPMLPPYSAGAATSGLMKLLREGHKGVHLPRGIGQDRLLDRLGDPLLRRLPRGKRVDRGGAEPLRPLPGKAAADGSDRGAERAGTPPRQRRRGQARPGPRGPRSRAGDRSVRRQRIDAGPTQGQGGTFPPAGARRAAAYEPGDRVVVRGAKYLALQFDARLGETLLRAPRGEFSFPIPCAAAGAKARSRPYPVEAFSSDRPRISVRAASVREIDTYRNLACNPYDVRGESKAFPHATASSECRNEAVFAARNAIDGRVENRRHGGWPYQSWGPGAAQGLVVASRFRPGGGNR